MQAASAVTLTSTNLLLFNTLLTFRPANERPWREIRFRFTPSITIPLAQVKSKICFYIQKLKRTMAIKDRSSLRIRAEIQSCHRGHDPDPASTVKRCRMSWWFTWDLIVRLTAPITYVIIQPSQSSLALNPTILNTCIHMIHSSAPRRAWLRSRDMWAPMEGSSPAPQRGNAPAPVVRRREANPSHSPSWGTDQASSSAGCGPVGHLLADDHGKG